MFEQLARRKVIAIHNAIDTASESALIEAKKITGTVRTTDHEVDVSRRLNNIGFANSITVKQTVSKINVSNMLIKDAEIIQDYQVNYPTLKFLTVVQLDTICKKYNLIYAPVGNYIGEVPEKNLIDIENAPQIKKEHCKETVVTVFVDIFGDYASKEFKKKFKNGVRLFQVDIDNWNEICNGAYNTRFYEFLYRHNINTTGITGHDRSSFVKSFRQETDATGTLFIAAPKSEFNVKKSKRSVISSIFTVTRDPIVFKFVKNGVLVLTKWGLEGKDSALVNEIEN